MEQSLYAILMTGSSFRHRIFAGAETIALPIAETLRRAWPIYGSIMFTTRKTGNVRFSSPHKVSCNFPVEYYILTGLAFRGAVIGYLGGRPIRETAIDEDGLRYRFVGIAPRDVSGRYDVFALDRGEWIVEPGLIYVADQEHEKSGDARIGTGRLPGRERTW